MAFPIGAALTAGASLLGGLLDNGDSAAQRKWVSQENALNRQFQHDEAELAYNRNEATRLDQNKWNSEPEQVKRLKQAGINPYNALSGLSGSSVTSSGNTASAGNASGSQMSYQRANNVEIAQGLAQAGLIAAQTRKLNKEADNLGANTKGQELTNAFLQMQNDIFKDYGRAEALIRLNKLDAERGFTDAQAQYTRILTKIGEFDLNKMKPQQYKNLFAEEVATWMKAKLDEASALKTDAERDLAYRRINWELSVMASIYAKNMASAYNETQQGNFAAAGIPVQGALAGMYEYQGQHARWNAGNARLNYYNNQKLINGLSDNFIATMKSKYAFDSRYLNALNNNFKLTQFLNSVSNIVPFANGSPFMQVSPIPYQ